MKAILTFLFLLILPQITFAETSIQLSEKSSIRLETCMPGDAIYSAFGHSGIRVVDSLNRIDVVFNYGAFNSTINQFYVDFLKGKPTFFLVIVPTQEFLQEYKEESRGVVETALILDIQQRQKIFDYLMWNAQPENYAYQYDFVFDNCATRIRDVFEINLGSAFSFNFQDSFCHASSSFKSMLYSKLGNHPLVELGFSLILGIEMDKMASCKEQLFLPENLLIAFQHATNNGQKIVEKKIEILPSKIQTQKQSFNYLFVLVVAICILLLSSLYFKSRRLHYFIAIVLLLVFGLLGAFLLAMWLMTDNTSTFKNYNLLWAMPTNVLVAILLLLGKSRLTVKYIQWYGLYLLLLLIVYPFIPQTLHFLVYIIMFSSGVYFYCISKTLTYQGNTPLS